jgi:hypothetical protein
LSPPRRAAHWPGSLLFYLPETCNTGVKSLSGACCHLLPIPATSTAQFRSSYGSRLCRSAEDDDVRNGPALQVVTERNRVTAPLAARMTTGTTPVFRRPLIGFVGLRSLSQCDREALCGVCVPLAHREPGGLEHGLCVVPCVLRAELGQDSLSLLETEGTTRVGDGHRLLSN